MSRSDRLRTAASVVSGTIQAVAGHHLVGKAQPLSATLAPTNRCQARCGYCSIPETRPSPEREPEWWIRLIGALHERGTRRIGFTGGEPLLYPDLDQLAAAARQHGILVSSGTNGLLVPERKDVLEHLNYLVISYDGPHSDEVRYPGCTAAVERAIEAAKAMDVMVWVTAVVTRQSADTLDATLQWAKATDVKLNIQLPFHPDNYCGQDNEEIVPSQEQVAQILEQLRAHAVPGGQVLNSPAYLDHVKRWAHTGNRIVWTREGQAHPCMGGRLFIHVEPDGTVNPCCHLVGTFSGLRVDAMDALDAALAQAEKPGCHTCLSAYGQEQSLLFGLDRQAVTGWGRGVLRALTQR